jgi:hypothetical protein
MTRKDPGANQEPGAWVNIGKIVFLILVLVIAWFILERLIGNK